MHDLIQKDARHGDQHKDQGPEQECFLCGSHMCPLLVPVMLAIFALEDRVSKDCECVNFQ